MKFEQRFDLEAAIAKALQRGSPIVRAKSELRGRYSTHLQGFGTLQSRDAAAEFGLRTEGKKECNFSPMVNADPKRASIRA